jgi:hypothetical protein
MEFATISSKVSAEEIASVTVFVVSVDLTFKFSLLPLGVLTNFSKITE